MAILLAANLAWTTLCLGGYRPETMVWSFPLTGGILVLLLARRVWLRTTPPLHPAGWYLLPFLIYAACNVWQISPVRWLGWADWLGWGGLAATFWISLNGLGARGPRRLVHGTVVVVGVVAMVMGIYQRFVDADWLMLGRTQSQYFHGRASGPFGIPNSLAALLLLLLPTALAVAVLGKRMRPTYRLVAAWLAVVYLAGLALTLSRGALLSLAVALAVWPLLTPGRRWQWKAGMVAVVAGVGLLLGFGLYQGVPGAKDRFDRLVDDAGETTRPAMWLGAWQLFKDEPLTGTGGGSYNILFERHRPVHFRDEPQWAHNDYLNTLSDYGLVGVLLGFGGGVMAAGLAWRAGASRRGTRAMLARAQLIGLFAFGLSLLFDFHLKIPALAMIVAVCAADWIRRLQPLGAPVPPTMFHRMMAGVGAGVVLALTLGLALPHYRAEALRYGERRAIDGLAQRMSSLEEEREVLIRAREAFARAVTVNPANAQAWSDLAYAHALWARHDPAATGSLGGESEQAARRALALSGVVPEFWCRLGVALDMQGRWAEAGLAFGQALELAPHSATAWYHLAYHLSLYGPTRALARTAASTCLRLDPGHRSAEALRRLLAGNP